MKLPLLLPKEFDDLRGAESERELFARVSRNVERAVEFLGIAGDDETWCDRHAEFIKKYFQWLTELFYQEQLNIELAIKVKEIVHANSRAFSSHLYDDMVLKLGEEEIPANSLLLAAASPYFHRLIRQMASHSERVLKLRDVDVSVAKPILEMLHTGGHNLWRKQEDELEKVLVQARVWDLDEMADEAETLLIRYVRPQNVEEVLLKARKKRWHHLEAGATEIYNRLELGLKLYSPELGVLIAEFLDLKSLTTLAAYQKLAHLVSICKFTGSLASEPDFLTVINLTPKLKGLDFTETSSPPYSLEGIPESLESLNLARASWATDEQVVELIGHFKELSKLDLSDLTWIGLPVWAALSSLAGLRELNLSGLRQIKDENLSLIALSPLSLEVLTVARCKNLSYEGLQQILRAAPRLTRLNLDGVPLSQERLEALVKQYPRVIFEKKS